MAITIKDLKSTINSKLSMLINSKLLTNNIKIGIELLSKTLQNFADEKYSKTDIEVLCKYNHIYKLYEVRLTSLNNRLWVTTEFKSKNKCFINLNHPIIVAGSSAHNFMDEFNNSHHTFLTINESMIELKEYSCQYTIIYDSYLDILNSIKSIKQLKQYPELYNLCEFNKIEIKTDDQQNDSIKIIEQFRQL